MYEQFTGHDPQSIEHIERDIIDTGLTIGQCTGILYETVRDGVKERYIHEFAPRSRPALVASFDGSKIELVGGKYNFTDRGIVDF